MYTIALLLKGTDKIYDTNCCTTSGYISGEVKLALTLSLLAGGGIMDLGIIFELGSYHYRKLMYDVLLEWIIKSDIGGINMVHDLGDNEVMARVSAGFQKDSMVS